MAARVEVRGTCPVTRLDVVRVQVVVPKRVGTGGASGFRVGVGLGEGFSSAPAGSRLLLVVLAAAADADAEGRCDDTASS